MKVYVGLDVSVKSTAICIVDEKGRVIKERSLATEPATIADWLIKTKYQIVRVGHEAGSLSAWLHEGLQQAGLPVVCVEARHMATALAAMPNKTDRKDAQGIAEMMRFGWYRSVHVKSHQAQELRLLLVARQTLIGTRRNIENTIRGTLKVFGLKVGAVSRLKFTERVRELVCNRPEIADTIGALLTVRDAVMAQYTELHRRLKQAAREDAVCRRLMTAPGVGPVVAVNFRAGVDEPKRFKKSSSVGAHFGMTSKRFNSGEIDRQGSISKCGDGMVRAALYEAAHVLLTRSKQPCRLKTWGLEIAKRGCMARAKVAVARKLAVILHRMWVDETDFRLGEEAAA